MYRFFLFLRRIVFILLFIAIEGFSVRYFVHSSGYNGAKAVSVSNFFVGDIYAGIQRVKHYFSLGRENRLLNEEVARLRERLQGYELPLAEASEDADSLVLRDTLDRPLFSADIPYIYSTARVVNNSISGARNLITLEGGSRDGVRPDMAVVSDGAVAGYVVSVSNRFAVAVSILSTRFRTSGRIAGSDYFGSVHWDARAADEAILSEVPKYAPIAVGDTIVTTDYSSYFPPGLRIGTVRSFELVNDTYYDARIALFADMAALNHVVLIDYADRAEKIDLETRAAEEQTP